MSAVHIDRCTEARAHLKDLLDAAERGRVATIRRDSARTAVIPGLPVAADGATFDEAISEMIDALREYAEDWRQRLLDAPDHRNGWGLVQLISYSDEDQLCDWLVGTTR